MCAYIYDRITELLITDYGPDYGPDDGSTYSGITGLLMDLLTETNFTTYGATYVTTYGTTYRVGFAFLTEALDVSFREASGNFPVTFCGTGKHFCQKSGWGLTCQL